LDLNPVVVDWDDSLALKKSKLDSLIQKEQCNPSMMGTNTLSAFIPSSEKGKYFLFGFKGVNF